MTNKFKPGDVVRIIDDGRWGSTFIKKVKDRDAIVEYVGKEGGYFYGAYMIVRFQKRNGRGKEFSERIRSKFLEHKESAT